MKAHFPRIGIEVHRDDIPVATMEPRKAPDEKWRYVDKQGHGHFWAEGGTGKLPTLRWVVTGKEWVGDEYGGEEYEVGEWRCRICHEVVEPKRRLEYGPTHIPGPTWITVTIEEESFVVDPDAYARSVRAWAKALRKESGEHYQALA